MVLQQCIEELQPQLKTAVEMYRQFKLWLALSDWPQWTLIFWQISNEKHTFWKDTNYDNIIIKNVELPMTLLRRFVSSIYCYAHKIYRYLLNPQCFHVHHWIFPTERKASIKPDRRRNGTFARQWIIVKVMCRTCSVPFHQTIISNGSCLCFIYYNIFECILCIAP